MIALGALVDSFVYTSKSECNIPCRVCACVRVCVRACVRVCVCASVRLCERMCGRLCVRKSQRVRRCVRDCVRVRSKGGSRVRGDAHSLLFEAPPPFNSIPSRQTDVSDREARPRLARGNCRAVRALRHARARRAAVV
eukprot:6210356-Pleurochrysis_carterae.AAC.1